MTTRGVALKLGLDPSDLPPLVRMGTLAAILIGTYTIAKVLRDALFIGEFGALSLPYAYIAVALCSAGYVFVESHVAYAFPRLGARRFSQTVAIACSLALAVALPRARHTTAALFYLWVSSQALMLLPHFWALALDLWDSRRARRLFPLLGGCGLIGGLSGGALAAASAKVLPQTGLIWVLPALLIVVRVLTATVEHRHTRRTRAAPAASGDSTFVIFRRSRYIQVLTVALALGVCIGTLVDFQFKIFAQKMFPQPHELTRFLGTFQVALNSVALLMQFGATGWLLTRLGLGASTGLQPGAILAFGTWAALTTGGWAVIAMRWLQGVVSLTLGKSSNEIYYAAIRAHDRRRIKPALDTLIERWSDAVVGVILLVAMRLLQVPVGVIVSVTAVAAAVWLFVLFGLNRQYGSAFREALSRRSFDPEEVPESLRLPAARRAILDALESEDEPRLLAALRFSALARHPAIAHAVRARLDHPSPAVQAAAIEAMERQGLRDPEGRIEALARDPDEAVRRAAVRHVIALHPDARGFAKRILETPGDPLQAEILDALAAHPAAAEGLFDRARVETWIASGRREDLLLAARALEVIDAVWTVAPLRALLATADDEVRRAALAAAARHPRMALLETLLPLMSVPSLGREARRAVVAIGDAAVPPLTRLLEGEEGERAQAHAAGTLARIGTPRARAALATLVRNNDVRLRHLGLSGLARVRLETGRPVLSRGTAHRLFLREMRDYRACVAPAAALADHADPALRLLGESWRESAGRAVERGVQALACWYDPGPLFGMIDRLRPDMTGDAAPALEYLALVLPRRVFQAVGQLLEQDVSAPPSQEASVAEAEKERERLHGSIRAAWENGDAWLRAVAVRASRSVPEFDTGLFVGDGGDPMVRDEIAALAAPGPRAAAVGRC
ncbi:MAG TPA: Npt1/Npt2 family nucleotide transporter [Candidatus Polarisedimenticolia bacterium]|nr:Npt1/Npt2 family nucleotide transporter [Candidatus Polarisedimenticolia bacterium]